MSPASSSGLMPIPASGSPSCSVSTWSGSCWPPAGVFVVAAVTQQLQNLVLGNLHDLLLWSPRGRRSSRGSDGGLWRRGSLPALKRWRRARSGRGCVDVWPLRRRRRLPRMPNSPSVTDAGCVNLTARIDLACPAERRAGAPRCCLLTVCCFWAWRSSMRLLPMGGPSALSLGRLLDGLGAVLCAGLEVLGVLPSGILGRVLDL